MPPLRRYLSPTWAIAALLAILYGPLLVHWVDGWLNKSISIQHEYFSHGLLGLPVAAYLAWGDRQSVAVVQWYALPSGGHPSPGQWFWANQWSQLTRRALTPWVAVSLVLPMEPLGAIADYQPLAAELTALIQQQLTATVFP